jgi:hypothetical protein
MKKEAEKNTDESAAELESIEVLRNSELKLKCVGMPAQLKTYPQFKRKISKTTFK